MSHNHDVGILNGDKVAVLGIRGDAKVWQRNPADNQLSPLPAGTDSSLTMDAIAYSESAYDMFEQYRTHPLRQTSISEDLARQQTAALGARPSTALANTKLP